MDTLQKNHVLRNFLQLKKDGKLPEKLVVHQYGQPPYTVHRGPADWNKETGSWPQPTKDTVPNVDALGFPHYLGDFIWLKNELRKAGITLDIDKGYEYTIPPEHRVSDPEGEERPPLPNDWAKMSSFEREDYLARQEKQ